jgi:hypothetical protein
MLPFFPHGSRTLVGLGLLLAYMKIFRYYIGRDEKNHEKSTSG